METTPEIIHAPVSAPAVAPVITTTPKAMPRDFFLWLGFIIALYGSIGALISLLFDYINIAYPDALISYSDPYSSSVRFAMATLIVLAPTAIVLIRVIRGIMQNDPSREKVWVRRWALVLTIFIAAVTILIDIITLVNTYLNGETSARFTLKVAVVLLIALVVFLHFLADTKGYWIVNPKKAMSVGIGAFILCLATVVSGLFIIGSPTQARVIRFDQQKVLDLQNIQYQVTNYWQLKQKLPTTLTDLNDPIASYTVPTDAQSGAPYEYRVTGARSFELCATFNAATPAETLSKTYPAYGGVDSNLTHGVGRTCFARTIDPERYPALPPANVTGGKPI